MAIDEGFGAVPESTEVPISDAVREESAASVMAHPPTFPVMGGRRGHVTLRELVNELVEREGSQLAAAKVSGIGRMRLRLVARRPEGEEGFELVGLLKLAKALRRSPAEVINAAGKPEWLWLVESMFGPARLPDVASPNTLMGVTPIERAVIEAMRVAKVAGASSASSDLVPHGQDDVPAHEGGE